MQVDFIIWNFWKRKCFERFTNNWRKKTKRSKEAISKWNWIIWNLQKVNWEIQENQKSNWTCKTSAKNCLASSKKANGDLKINSQNCRTVFIRPCDEIWECECHLEATACAAQEETPCELHSNRSHWFGLSWIELEEKGLHELKEFTEPVEHQYHSAFTREEKECLQGKIGRRWK